MLIVWNTSIRCIKKLSNKSTNLVNEHTLKFIRRFNANPYSAAQKKTSSLIETKLLEHNNNATASELASPGMRLTQSVSNFKHIKPAINV